MIFAAISTYSVLIWIAAAITASLGLVVYLGSTNRSSRFFLLTVISVFSWMVSVGAFISSADVYTATAFVKLAYFTGTLAAAAFFFFFLVYPENKKPETALKYVIIAVLFVMGYLYFFTDSVIALAYPVTGASRFGWRLGSLWFLFYFVFYFFFLGGLVLLLKKVFTTVDSIARRNSKYMFWGVLVLLIPPSVMNVIMPQFGNFSLIWLGPILSLGWVSVIAYSIVRYHQLDIRTFTTEILAIALMIIFFANIFSGLSGGIVGRSLAFVVFLVIGYELVRLSVKISDLNEHLKDKVADQTKEIRRLYEVEKAARLELERLNEAKNQFIKVTEHHLRTPVTQIKWSLELLRDQKLPDESLRSGIENGIAATNRLQRILENFLNIAALQVGKNILAVEALPLLSIINEVAQELTPDIKRRKLSLDYSKKQSDWPAVAVDRLRIKEVLFVIIQNAVYYNEDGGFIHITPSIAGSSFNVTVENSGIGIEPKEQDWLMKEIFGRGEAAAKINPLGMGLGLAFAHYVIKAHHGSIKIESAGKNRGAMVVISLPLQK